MSIKIPNQQENQIVLLNKDHNRTTFNCGIEELNEYLKKYALQNQKKNATRTYLIIKENCVIGYYSLAYSSVIPSEVPRDIGDGLGRYPIPILLLARLAVDISEKGSGSGLGKLLLKYALLKAVQASEIAGLRTVAVHAKNDDAKSFYKYFGFESRQENTYHLFLMIASIKANLDLD